MSISTTAKHGNVLVLLNTLYTSGFASMPPTIPLLTSRTMHTLYAASFLIYSMNCVCNWLHIYCLLNGYLTSFPLRLWFVISVVFVAVTGSMLCSLLVVSEVLGLSKMFTDAMHGKCLRPSFRHNAVSKWISDGGRLNEFDETWPIRWSVDKVYGEFPTKTSTETLYVADPVDHQTWSAFFATIFSFFYIKMLKFFSKLFKIIVCACLIVLSYTGCFLMGCLPCLYFYTCRKNSFSHRHKCSKTFVCIQVNLDNQTISPILLPSPMPFFDYWTKNLQLKSINPELLIQTIVNPKENLYCKPFWDSRSKLGLYRKKAGPWQLRVPIDSNQILAISTHFVSDYSQISEGHLIAEDPFRQIPKHILFYDFALLKAYPIRQKVNKQIIYNSTFGTRESIFVSRKTLCHKYSLWKFSKTINNLGFPYFLACNPSISVERERKLIDCAKLI